MAHVIASRVQESATTTGTGAFTLTGAITQMRAFSAVCSVGDTVWYVIESIDVPAEWELGRGTYSGANTLTRTTVIASSNAGSAVTFSAGNKRVSIVAVNPDASTAVSADWRAALSISTAERQTVISGPVDSSGLAAFGGATGSTTVTASGTLIAKAASAHLDRVGSITNPSWTGLSTNGTMYLFLDVAADGTCTTGSTTLAPVYQWGGTYSVTNLQNTYNIQEMTMKVGNGATASQVWRVFVGEVTVAAAVVSAIAWYQLQGRYDSGWTATAPGTNAQPVRSHNLGTQPEIFDFIMECTTTDNGWTVGSRVKASQLWTSDGTRAPINVVATRTQVLAQTGSAAGLAMLNTAGAGANVTAASWKYKFIARRGW